MIYLESSPLVDKEVVLCIVVINIRNVNGTKREAIQFTT